LNFTSILGIRPDPLSWTSIMQDYHHRDLKTVVQNDYAVWRPSKGSSFIINGHFKIPKNRVYYTPGSAEVLKNGWIQYLAYFILVFMIVYASLWFVFHNQIVSTFVMNPLSNVSQETTPLKSLMY
jgi:transmembrane protein 231